MVARTLARMLAGTSDMRRNTPKTSSRVTCDTIVEITDTPAYLMSFTLDGCAIICRTRACRDCSDAQMWDSVGCPPCSVTGASRSHADRRGQNRHGLTLAWPPILLPSSG